MKFSNHNLIPPHLKEAMSLIKKGQLKNATTAIQNSLSGRTSDSANDDHTMRDVTPKAFAQKEIPVSNDASKNTDKKPDEQHSTLQSLHDKLKDFRPSALNIGAMSGVTSTHKEPPIPKNAQFIKGDFRSSQGNHEYRLYVPSNYLQASKQDALPLIVMLHGCTQSPEDFASGTRMNELAETHQCLVLYPSQPVSANPNRCWNWFNTSDQQRDQGEPAWLAALTTSITKEYEVDASKVYIAGLSAGAAMAVIMAKTYPELYAAVGVHSGLAYKSASGMPSAMMAMRKGGTDVIDFSAVNNSQFVRTIIFHGDQDHTVSVRNGGQVFEQAKQHLQAQTSHLNTQQHQKVSAKSTRSTQTQICDDKGVSQLEYWKIHGASHSWAGGSSAGSYTDPNGPNASEEMMRFFLSH